jgi:ferredoxin--NADP+ reductase
MQDMPDTSTRLYTVEYVQQVFRWSPSLFSLRITRPTGFHFQPGHYVRLGLPVPGETTPGATVWRPYSVVSAPLDTELEFLITTVPDGILTPQLARCAVGQPLALESATLGFFVVTQFSPGEDLWMMATGAGLGPYVALLRTPDALKRFSRIVVVHSVRHATDLAYADELNKLAAASSGRLRYVPVVTREADATQLRERIPSLLEAGHLEAETGMALAPENSRVMVCGNPGFTADMRRLLTSRGFQPCRRGLAGNMLFENYW